MKIEVNGEQRDIAATDLTKALAELGWSEVRVATALNGTFVPAAARCDTPLAPGDRLEVLTAMQGG
ncbi:sulfur carrier protein ThiS [Roseovarius sp. ZX-A-9]|uniref:sulfur carrier protein ThiS n=1 Tax=Roseovarius sp. ZX-A-9 TaxID=3014783 RepID=UPI00232EF739|nr:sulfur carrier protein ThiS [Roseovarius sp. ZX-A-9]